jgi:hypothetical protein
MDATEVCRAGIASEFERGRENPGEDVWEGERIGVSTLVSL